MARQVKKIAESKSSNHCCQLLEPKVSHVLSLSELLIDIQREVKKKSTENARVKAF